jgi:hypothetical protein
MGERDMKKRVTRSTKKVKALPAKSLTVRQARSVKGGPNITNSKYEAPKFA